MDMINSDDIKRIIDISLEKFIEVEGNTLPQEIELEMADPNQDIDEEWKIWFPIKSTVTDDEIKELEIQLGFKYPEDYKVFLKHKHFYELYISKASFYEHPINTWKKSLLEVILDHNKKNLIEKGFIPFAMWEDWGCLCFDTNRNNGDNNYPVVLWDHEQPDKIEEKYITFYELMKSNDTQKI